MERVISKSSGRVCLLGDKNDLLNRPVIAASISKFFEFEITKSTSSCLKFSFPQENISFSRDFHENKSDDFFKFLSQISWRLKNRIAPVEVKIFGDLPIGCGLSSSAACSVGYLRGLSKMFHLGLDVKEIAEIAYQVERNDLGIMCGRMDQYSIAYSGVTYIETGDSTSVTNLPINSIPLVIGNSNEPRKAKMVLNKTMEKLMAKDPLFMDCFESINDGVLRGITAIRHNDMKLLGKLMNKHQAAEKAMGASTPKLDRMCKAALDAGALGAKQVGAGGGGCMIALCPKETDKIMKALLDAGGIAWKADLAL